MATLASAPILAPSNRWEPLSSSSSSSSPALSTSSSFPSSNSSTSTYCTGRSRSNTLTAVLHTTPNNGLFSEDLSAALGSLSIGSGGVRPRKGSVARRDRSSSFSSGFSTHSSSTTTTSSSAATLVASPSWTTTTTHNHDQNNSASHHPITDITNITNITNINILQAKINHGHHHSTPRSVPITYPPRPLPHTSVDHDMENTRNSKEEGGLYHPADTDHEPLLPLDPSAIGSTKATTTATMTAAQRPKKTLSSGWNFFLRVLTLIGLFLASLGGLYLMAELLPPLSLPKSIDDVKLDAEILQQFATADYDGWLRTFWVFSAVYIWKQSFGIPGSAFLNILAGALYGPWFGTLLTSLLTTAGSVVAYFVSWFLMEPILERYASKRLDQMRQMIQKKANSGQGSTNKTRAWRQRQQQQRWEEEEQQEQEQADESREALLPSWRDRTNPTTNEEVVARDEGGAGIAQQPMATSSSLERVAAVPHAFATPMLRTRSSSFTSRQTVVHIYPGSTATSTVAAGHQEATSSSPTAVVARQKDSLEFEIQPAADGGFDFSTVALPSYERSALEYETRLPSDGQMDMKTDKDHEEGKECEEEEEEEEEKEDGQGTSLFMQLLWIRLFPLTPYWFINLASPLVGVPLWPFMTSMFLGVTPYNYLCAQAGAILGEIHELRDIYQQPRIVLQIVLVVVLLSGTVWATKHFSKKQQESDQQALKRVRKKNKSRDSEEYRRPLANDEEASERLLGRPSLNGSEAMMADGQAEEQPSLELSTLHGQSKRDSTVIHIIH